jgi:hypothetical protein
MVFEGFMILFLIPIFLGWALLLAWPFLLSVYISLYSILLWAKFNQVEKLKTNKAEQFLIHNLLFSQAGIPWPKIYSSIELSCHTKIVSQWMNQLGVNDSSSRANSHFNEYRVSNPESYDLVTEILNCPQNKNLDKHYKFASQYMHKGAYFVDIEDSPRNHSLQSHLSAAKKSGLFLLERSDLKKNIKERVSRSIWNFTNSNSGAIMLVWCKT